MHATFSNRIIIPAALTALMSISAPVFAEGITSPESDKTEVALQDVGAAERVDYSGKLRMLSQRIPAAACNFNAGVAPEIAGKTLKGAANEFHKIVEALEFGDVSLNILGAEERRKTLVSIQKLRTLWGPMEAAALTLAETGPNPELMERINADNMTVLDAAKLLVVEVSGEYSNPTEMLQVDALLVDISGRQRMLTQKMSKESCQIWSGADASAQKALAGTMQMFEISLLALRDGLAAAGIKPAPTAEILSGLQNVHNQWLEVKPFLTAAAAGMEADTDRRADVFGRLNVMLKDMNAVVGLYAVYAKIEL